jgi:dUTP pyrophosphatase
MSSQSDTFLRFVKLTENALTPTRGSLTAEALDLRSAYDATVPARGRLLIKPDLQVKLLDGCYFRIAARSGLGLKYQIDFGGGIVDDDYRGNLG